MDMIGHVHGSLYEMSETEFLDSYAVSKTALQRMKLKNRYNTPEYTKGKATESLVRELLLNCFDGVEDVYLTPPGSRADDDLKVDLVVRTQGGHLFGFQVKSSECGARQHLQKDTEVPVMWVNPDNKAHRVAFIKGMAEYMAMYIQYKPALLDAWSTRRTLVQGGVYTLPNKVATTRFGVEGMRLLRLLGLACVQADQFVFGNKPTK